MKQSLTKQETNKIQQMCFDDPSKMCAIAQLIIDVCQVVSVTTYSELKGKHRNTIIQQKNKLTGLKIEQRKYISLNQ